MAAKFMDFSDDTWVRQIDFIDKSEATSYYWCLYWAFQTLTTVGYGDFGAYNIYELVITIVWMGFGVAFYSIVLGTMTSILTEQMFNQESLQNKLKAFSKFKEETNLDRELYERIRMFMQNNYNDMNRMIDEETMLNELPSTIKEEVQFHRYGSIIKKFQFFKKQTNNSFVWQVVKCLTKIAFEKNDVIYHDDSISDSMYLIHNGIIKLHAENDFPYAVYRESTCFGDQDIFLNQRRNGTAKSIQKSQLYKLTKNNIEDILQDYPDVRRMLIEEAIDKNKILIEHRLVIVQKNPAYGMKDKMAERTKSIKMMMVEFQNKEIVNMERVNQASRRTSNLNQLVSVNQSVATTPKCHCSSQPPPNKFNLENLT